MVTNGGRSRGLGSAAALILALALALALWGCAAPTAYREGTDLARDGRYAEALPRFAEAVRLEPSSAEYRAAYLRTRERLIADALAAADQAREAGELDAAAAGYKLVLSQFGNIDRATTGLRAIDARKRWDALLKEARAAAKRKDWPATRAAAKAVLQERPDEAVALELLREADRAMAAAAPAEKGLTAAYRKPISIEFRDTTLKTIFEIIARTSGLNFVFDKDIRTDQKTSIFLKNSTIEAAVSMLLASNQLDQKVLDANSILIYPNTAAKQREHQNLVVRSFYLANADAKTVANTLKTLLKMRDAVVDEKLNLVIVRDSAEAIRIAERIVALHDVPDAEVMLELEVLEVKRARLLELGVRWPESLILSPLPSDSGGTLTLADLQAITSATTAVTVGPLTINAKKADGDVNILANPRVRARNREKAKIHIGDRLPIISTTATSTGFVSESVTYVDVGLKVDVEPTIYLDNEVAIKISLEVSNIVDQVRTRSGTLAYQLGTRTASTVLRLKDGENQVLAGLIGEEDRRTASKVPGLGEIPILGRLFGSQLDETAKTEIVLSITPRVVRNVQRPESAMMEFDSGTEANAGTRGADAATAPTAVPAGGAPPLPRTTAPAPAGNGPATGLPAPVQPGSPATAAPAGAAAVVPIGQETGSVSTRWQGPAVERVGEQVSVRLMAQSDQPVTALPLVVGFDPKILQVSSVVEGEFLRQGGALTSFRSQLDATGQVLVTATRSGNTGATAEATVVTLNFSVIAGAGSETRLVVQNVAPLGLSGQAMTGRVPAAFVLSISP